MLTARYSWRYQEARAVAADAVDAAVSGDRRAKAQHEIRLLRIHLQDPITVAGALRARRTIALWEMEAQP